MKNKNLIVALSKLLKIDQTVIEAELEKENGDDSIVKAYTDKHHAYTVDELRTYTQNANKQYMEKADFDINDVPKGLYNKIAAAAFESREKALAKEHGITDKYENLQDLLNKIVTSKTGKGVDEETKQQIQTMKSTIQGHDKALADAVAAERSKYDNEFIDRDRSSALSAINLDYEDNVIANQRKLLMSSFSNEKKVVRKDGKTIVLGSDGQPILNKLGEPESIANVLKTHASEYGFKIKAEDSGGRGAGSSEGVQPSVYKGKTFDQALSEKGVKPNTNEADKLYVEWKAQNPK